MPNAPSGWTQVFDLPEEQDSDNKNNSNSNSSNDNKETILCRQNRIGLYDGEKDLRNLGEGELILTTTRLHLSFLNARNAPGEAGSLSPKLFLEIALSNLESATVSTRGFVMFSSPKIILNLRNQKDISPKLSFREGGMEFFLKQIEQCLKKKSWLGVTATTNTSSSSTTASACSAATTTTKTTATTTTIFSPQQQQQQQQQKTESEINKKSVDNKNIHTEQQLPPPSFSTSHAGIAGVISMQNERSDQLRKQIKTSTTEVDELISKSKELVRLMSRFRQEVAKSDFKLCGEQLELLKRLDARFFTGVAGDHHIKTSSSFPSSTPSSPSISSSTTTSSSFISKIESAVVSKQKTTLQQQKERYVSADELSHELLSFLKSDAVLSHAVRVPLVELFSAFNIFRSFTFEVTPQEFHEALCVLVKDFPQRKLCGESESECFDPEVFASFPSFALREDQLVQFHVLAAFVPVLENILGPMPKVSFFVSSQEQQREKTENAVGVAGGSKMSSASQRSDAVLAEMMNNNNNNQNNNNNNNNFDFTEKLISPLEFAKLLHVPVDEALQLLLQLEMGEGILVRDEHSSSGGLKFSWNLFAIF